MDAMDRLNNRQSIVDAIAIFDSAPIHLDLVPDGNIVQLTNRVPIAHLAIERGLKALIAEAKGSWEHTHGLNGLYRDLAKSDPESTTYLNVAFKDAVSFFGYNVNAKGNGYLRTLYDYLSMVGTEAAFEKFRSWVLGEFTKGDSSIRYIRPLLHREIMSALCCLFLPNSRETVSQRVEREVSKAIEKKLSFIEGSDKEKSVLWFIDLFKAGDFTPCDALEEASHSKFSFRDEEFISLALREAYGDLQQSDDPAVQYFVRKLGYLPKGSQPPNPGVDPAVEWLNKAETRGKVSTPGGTCLGLIERYSDGGWGIKSIAEGLGQVADVANARKDAVNYLANRLTKQVTVTKDGQTKELRIVNERDSFLYRSGALSGGLSFRAPTYDLEFWDAEHGLHLGDVISVELQSDRSSNSVAVLEGTVSGVSDHKVSVVGTETFTPRDDR